MAAGTTATTRATRLLTLVPMGGALVLAVGCPHHIAERYGLFTIIVGGSVSAGGIAMSKIFDADD